MMNLSKQTMWPFTQTCLLDCTHTTLVSSWSFIVYFQGIVSSYMLDCIILQLGILLTAEAIVVSFIYCVYSTESILVDSGQAPHIIKGVT